MPAARRVRDVTFTDYAHDPATAEDIVGHGTHVAGIIAATANNRLGVTGICRCDLHVYKIFGDKPDAAIDSWVWGLLGFIFLPWTTLMYIIAWSPVVGINGFWDVLLIVIGVLLDIASYAAKPAFDRRRAY